MLTDKDTQRLIEALRLFAKGGARPEFPFDHLEFTLNWAADELERLSKASQP